MSEVILYPTANGDDGMWNAAAFYATGWDTIVGYDSDSGLINSFFRFPVAVIPKGVTIDSAILTLKAQSSHSSGTVNVKVYANDIDDAVAPTDIATAQALTNTTAYGQWDNLGAWTAESTYNSPDLKAVIQEIIDRDEWASGNALMLFVRNNASTGHRDARTYNYGSGYATLTINYHLVEPLIIEVPVASLTLTPQNPSILPIFMGAPAALALTALAPSYVAGINVPSAGLTLSAYAPTLRFDRSIAVPVASLTLTPKNPSYKWNLLPADLPFVQVIYK